jgi:hypothetical protein
MPEFQDYFRVRRENTCSEFVFSQCSGHSVGYVDLLMDMSLIPEVEK